jgi:hypothetical protein
MNKFFPVSSRVRLLNSPLKKKLKNGRCAKELY